jgi:DNA-binding NarL/FixJ family response regulator
MPKRVLIASGNLNTREMIRASMEHTGVEICAQTANGREAFDAAMALRPNLLVSRRRNARLERYRGSWPAEEQSARVQDQPASRQFRMA